MPTATAVMSIEEVQNSNLKSQAAFSPMSNASLATLRSLYPRAAKAFLQRDVSLAHSLISSAFSILPPPPSITDDGLSDQRRKWDILRVTFETTVFSSPPQTEDPEAFPAALRANQMLSPQQLLSTLHSRSLQLFTPTLVTQKATPIFLPAQILITLVSASLKLDCVSVGRSMTEDWLARRISSPDSAVSDGYSKVLELYCLQVLPRLEEWDYAADFLQYERELAQSTRDQMLSSLRASRAQTIATRAKLSSASSPAPLSAEPSRTVSPAPSASTSSESSNSTHTATPHSPRLVPSILKGKGKANGHVNVVSHLTPSTSASSSSQSVSSVATSKTVTQATAGRGSRREHQTNGRLVPRHASRNPSESRSSPRSSREQSLQPPKAISVRPPTISALVRVYLDAMLTRLAKSKVITFMLVLIIFPLISVMFRLRRQKSIGANHGAVGDVRRRLRAVPNRAVDGKNAIAVIWDEVIRVLSDTVKMGGRGLV